MEEENSWDEVWVGVKSLSSLGIAGSPRNSFRASLTFEAGGGRALDGRGATRAQPNSEYRRWMGGSQPAGDNLRGREGNNPDRQLRPQSPG